MCPACNLVSPDTAQACDCGYGFEKEMMVSVLPTGSTTTPAKQSTDRQQLISGVHWKRVAFLVVLALISMVLFGDEQTGNFLETYAKYLTVPVIFFVLKGPWENLKRAIEQDKKNAQGK